MGATFRCVVGLGNPGAQYARTRHNAGQWLLDALAAQHQQRFTAIARCHGEQCRIPLPQGAGMRLFKPTTGMNRSGLAIAAIAQYFAVAPDELLIVHDDIDLPAGSVKLKRGGGHGGHNGLRDTIAVLKCNAFSRVRIGIGHPGSKDRVIPYVLTPPDGEQQLAIEQTIERTLYHWPTIISGELEIAMTYLHQGSFEKPQRDGDLGEGSV